MAECISCGNPVVLTTGGYAEDTTYLNTAPAESADMARQCGLSSDGRHHPKRDHYNANPILARMRDDYGDSDEWGTTMGWTFAVCEVIYFDSDIDVPAELGYHPSPVLSEVDHEQYPDGEVAEMFEAGHVTEDELRTAALCLSRYNTWLRAAGKDY